MATSLKQVFVEFQTKFDSTPLKQGAKRVENLSGKLKTLAGALIVGQAVRGISSLSKEMITLGDNIAKTAQRINFGTDALQEWQFTAGLAGVSSEELAKGISVLQRNIGQAAQGLETYQRPLRQIGLNFKDIQDIAPEDQLEKVALGIAGLERQTDKAAVAQQLFGRAGSKLLPLFAQGAAGIEEMRKEFRDLGIALDKDFLNSTEEAEDNLFRLNLITTKLKSELVRGLLPILGKVVKIYRDWAPRIQKVLENSNLLRAAFLVLIPVLTAFAISLLAPWLPAILAIGLLIVILDDFLTAMEGGTSVIGTFFEKFFEFPITDLFAAMIRDSSLFLALWDKIVLLPSRVQDGFAALGVTVAQVLQKVLNFAAPVAKVLSKVPGLSGLGDAFKGLQATASGAAQGENFDQFSNRVDRENINIDTDRSAAAADAARNFVRNAEGNRKIGASASAGASVNQNNNISVNVNANTNASPQDIAKQVSSALNLTMKNSKAALEGG